MDNIKELEKLKENLVIDYGEILTEDQLEEATKKLANAYIKD